MNMNRLQNVLDLVVNASRIGKYDSNVIGMAAEVIAEEVFGMIKAPRGTRDVDGHWYVDGLQHTVQVKAWSEDRVTRYRQGTYLRLKEDFLPDVLLCILVYCSKPGYEILYNGSPKSVGRVEKNRPSRVIRFGDMKTKNEIMSILRALGGEELVSSRVPRVSRLTDVSPVDENFKKPCSICGQSFGIDQFTYGNRSTNSYCKTCRKAVGEIYYRGGTEAANKFRQERRSKWRG
ncbi:hypothetical protein BH24ACI3_BH24ACI3_10600 [soil metagenome]